jgi:hypothetical protein
MLLFDAKVAQRKLSPLREGECGMETRVNFTFAYVPGMAYNGKFFFFLFFFDILSM